MGRLIPARTRGRGAWAGLAAAGLLGCGGDTPVREPVRTASEPPAFLPASPGRWAYLPPSPETPVDAVLELDGGRCLVVTGGDRWLVTRSPDAGRSCRGAGAVAADVDDEPLVTALRRTSSGAFLFVGERGTVFETPTPLGAFERRTTAPEVVSRVVSPAPGTLLGLTPTRELLRFAAGDAPSADAWTRAPGLPPRVVALEADGRGHVLALAWPEAVFASDDGGASFTRVATPPVGAQALVRTTDGLELRGLAGAFLYRPGEAPPFAARGRGRPAPATSADVVIEVGAAPTAEALLAGRAAIAGGQYLELALDEDGEGEAPRLARAPLGERLVFAPVPGLARCAGGRLAAEGRVVVLGCMEEPADGEGDALPALRLHRSVDGGATFAELATLSAPDVNDVRLGIAATGVVLATGACPRLGDPRAVCRPIAPVRVARAGGAPADVVIAAAGELGALAGRPVFSPDGGSAYFLGARAKDGGTAIFVSHDAGLTFRAQVVAGDALREPEESSEGDEDAEYESHHREEDEGTPAIVPASELRVDEEGMLGVAVQVEGSSATRYLLLDPDGQLVGASRPEEPLAIAGVGRRALAVIGREGHLLLAETLDGGGTWTTAPVPRGLSEQELRLDCDRAGCVVGAQHVRVGWGVGDTAFAGTAGPPPGRADVVRATRTPIVCELSPTTGWTAIRDVWSRGDPTGAPTEDEIARGAAAWSVVSRGARSDVTVHVAAYADGAPGELRVVARELLPAERTEHEATALSHQMEGYAASRITWKDGSPAKVTRAEIAWENLLEGSRGRKSLPDGGPLTRGLVVARGATSSFTPGLVSLSPGGVFFRPRSDVRTTSFLGNDGRVTAVDLPAVEAFDASVAVHPDAAAVGGALLATGSGVGSAFEVVYLAHPTTTGGRWATTVTSVVPVGGRYGESPRHAVTDWTYRQGLLGLTALYKEETTAGEATFSAFRADGTLASPTPLATPADLGIVPRPCTAEERAHEPRFDPPLQTSQGTIFEGTRHPVLVLEPPPPKGSKTTTALPPEPQVLLTGGVVLHGPPDKPCVAGFHATGIRRAPIRAVILGHLTQATLFRPGESSRSGGEGQTVEHRPMSCRFDPKAPVPEAVYSESGTWK